MVSCFAANAGVLPASKSPARVQPHGQSATPTEGFARSDRGARSGTGARERSQGERGIPEPRSGEDMPRKPLDGVERHTCPRGKRPPVSLCPTASAGVGAEGAAPPTRDWFLGMPPGRPFFPKRAKRAGEPVPPPVGATPRARRVATRRAARPSVRSALRRSTRLYAVKGSVLPFISREAIV